VEIVTLGGTNQGAILLANSNAIAMTKTEGILSRPAARGDYLTIYATGLGDVLDGVPTGMPAPLDRPIPPNNKISVVVGGVGIDPAFAGLAPGTVGLFQVNTQLPDGVPTGPAVPVYIKVILADGTVVESNKVTMAVAGGANQ